MMLEKQVYDVKETAEIFGVVEETIRRWVRTGKIRKALPVRKIYISKSDIEKILNSNKENLN